MKNKHAVALGRKGGSAGRGAAKARTSEQASAAAQARWSNRPPKSAANVPVSHTRTTKTP